MPVGNVGHDRRSRLHCQLCGGRVDPWARRRFPRLGEGEGEGEGRLLTGLQECGHCRRLGCATCMCMVEERADDFFFEQLACRECLAKEKRGP